MFHSFLFGIALTFLYDTFRIFRRVIPHGIFWISVEDLLFWIASSLGIFYLLYRENNGAFRWFAVFGAGIGMLLYKKTLSEWLVGLTAGICCRVLRITGMVLRKLFTPIRFLWRRINCRLTGLLKAIKIKLRRANDQRK